MGPPSWYLVKVLDFLHSSVFETLSSEPLHIVTMKVSFLLALATAKMVGELQALSSRITFLGSDLSLPYLPEFVAKMESERNPLPLYFVAKLFFGECWDLPEEYYVLYALSGFIWTSHRSGLLTLGCYLCHPDVPCELFRRTPCLFLFVESS